MRKKRIRRKRFWLGLAVAVSVTVIGVTAVAAVALYVSAADIKMDISLMEIPRSYEPAKLYAYDPVGRGDRSGELHPAEADEIPMIRPHLYAELEDIPTDLIHAFVAIEDKRFYDHKGVDVLRTARATLGYVTKKTTFGASTITQQLVKNLTGNDSYSPERKFNEICMALDLERRVTKEEILTAYLNIINLAEGCCGVADAAERYYSKPVSELSLSQSATIAAITNHPARYNPLVHPENNLKRRNVILGEMLRQGYITKEAYEDAVSRDLELAPAEPRKTGGVTSWYADLVISDVIADLQAEYGYSYSHASMLVYGGGLSVITAMDEALQRQVEDYYKQIDHFPVGRGGRPESAFILMDPATGDILAVAGAVGEKKASRLQSYATDTRRPAGSCIKPLAVYAPALDRGLITWSSLYEDEPLRVRNGQPWPGNADGLYRGRITVGEAMAHSVNTVTVRILSELGMENSFAFLQNELGMHSLQSPALSDKHDMTVSSLALGQQSYGVTLRELTAAYGVFLDGCYRPPVSYHRVLDREGKVLLENQPRDRRALTQETAAVMTKLLQEVTDHGTAARYLTEVPRMGISCAGKTGTTQNNCDRLFVGYTPRLLAGVWMGYDYPAEMRGIDGNPCVTVWDHIVSDAEKIYAGTPYQREFPLPAGVHSMAFCPQSGRAVGPFCTDPVYGHRPEIGWFVAGTEPNDPCDYHIEPPINVIPEDPSDPDRIPAFPNDLYGEKQKKPGKPRGEDGWLSRLFRFFAQGRQ